MEEEDKLPLKRVELSLSKFNEVAIPHHLDLLRQHRVNIMKYTASGEYVRVRGEQARARRVAAQLRTLLAELEALRRRVREPDRARFDQLTRRSRDRTLAAVVDYLESSPGAASGAASVTSTESVGVVAHAAADELLQLQVDERELELREREAVLRGWVELQGELRALHDAWQHVQAAALAQREQVEATASSVEEAAVNVKAARTDLALAERLKCGALGAGGAVVGALAGGPLGLLLGAKAAAAAALAGSALGYLGGRLVGRRRQAQLQQLEQLPAEQGAGEVGGAGEAGGALESRKER